MKETFAYKIRLISIRMFGVYLMKKKIKSLSIYTVALAVAFYILPMLIKDTGTGILMLLGVIPLIAFICALIYGIKQGFDLLLPIIAAVLFTPTLFIYYNKSAWVYIVAYAVITLVGNGIGRIFYKVK